MNRRSVLAVVPGIAICGCTRRLAGGLRSSRDYQFSRDDEFYPIPANEETDTLLITDRETRERVNWELMGPGEAEPYQSTSFDDAFLTISAIRVSHPTEASFAGHTLADGELRIRFELDTTAVDAFDDDRFVYRLFQWRGGAVPSNATTWVRD